MTDRVGQQISNYHLLRSLGKGGFAEVYLGKHIYLGSYATIKILHTRVAEPTFCSLENGFPNSLDLSARNPAHA